MKDIKKVLAVYFSGTGNTEYAVKRLCGNFVQKGIECNAVSVEDITGTSIFENADTVIVGYPIYGSCMPRIMREFLHENKQCFYAKKLITVVTQHLGSGDGGALAARILKGQVIEHIASLHINMPNNISDVKIVKIANKEKIQKTIDKANKKIDMCTDKILHGKRIKNGRHVFSRTIGFLSQRIYFRGIEKRLAKSIKIDKNLCVKCGQCVKACPSKNLTQESGQIKSQNNCILCYRCINLCPKKAIYLMGKNPPNIQYKGIK